MDFITDLSTALVVVGAGVALVLSQAGESSREQSTEEAMVPVPVEDRTQGRSLR